MEDTRLLIVFFITIFKKGAYDLFDVEDNCP